MPIMLTLIILITQYENSISIHNSHFEQQNTRPSVLFKDLIGFVDYLSSILTVLNFILLYLINKIFKKYKNPIVL